MITKAATPLIKMMTSDITPVTIDIVSSATRMNSKNTFLMSELG